MSTPSLLTDPKPEEEEKEPFVTFSLRGWPKLSEDGRPPPPGSLPIIHMTFSSNCTEQGVAEFLEDFAGVFDLARDGDPETGALPSKVTLLFDLTDLSMWSTATQVPTLVSFLKKHTSDIDEFVVASAVVVPSTAVSTILSGVLALYPNRRPMKSFSKLKDAQNFITIRDAMFDGDMATTSTGAVEAAPASAPGGAPSL